MNIINKQTILFLTACINPKGMGYTALQDKEIRMQQYLDAIRFYIETSTFRILVVENTGVDLSKYFQDEIASGRLECLYFEGNDFDRSLGKGYGEGLIINFAFSHSIFIKECKYIIKVSGRHMVVNLGTIMRASEFFLNKNPDLVVCEIDPKNNFARSDCYIASCSFYIDYLNQELSRCNDSINIWFENVLYDCVYKACKNGFQFLFLPFAIDQRGVSGTFGTKLEKTRLRRKLFFFGKMLLYKIGLRKLW